MGESRGEVRASRARIARAGCESERRATQDGRAGATYRLEEVNLDRLSVPGSGGKQGEKAVARAK